MSNFGVPSEAQSREDEKAHQEAAQAVYVVRFEFALTEGHFLLGASSSSLLGSSRAAVGASLQLGCSFVRIEYRFVRAKRKMLNDGMCTPMSRPGPSQIFVLHRLLDWTRTT